MAIKHLTRLQEAVLHVFRQVQQHQLSHDYINRGVPLFL